MLLSIQALLSAPNPDDPLANDVAELWKVNEAEAIRNAKDWTRTYAMGNWKKTSIACIEEQYYNFNYEKGLNFRQRMKLFSPAPPPNKTRIKVLSFEKEISFYSW